MATSYKEFSNLTKAVPNWDEFAWQTAGAVWEQGENQSVFYSLLFEAVAKNEAIVHTPYRDIKGHPTVGIGFLIGLVDEATGEWRSGQEAKARAQVDSYDWTLGGENGAVLSKDAAWDEFGKWFVASKKYVGNWGQKAAVYAELTALYLKGEPSELFRKKDDSGGYSASVKKTFPAWQELPFFGYVSAFYLAWMRGSVQFHGKTADPAREALIVESMTKGHYRDYEEASVTSAADSNMKGVSENSVGYQIRDWARACAKYYCAVKCVGACDRSADCKYKDEPPPAKVAPTAEPPAAEPVQARQPDPPPMKYDEWELTLRIWDPFVRSHGYSSAVGELISGTLFSTRGDNHLAFGDLSEKPEDAAHRVLLSAKFRYLYDDSTGTKVGYGIHAKEGLDPAIDSGLHSASSQKLPVFGPSVRYRSDDGTTWSTDTTETPPPNDPAGTEVNWAAAGADKFQSFSLKVNAENPFHPTLDPNLNATLNVAFTNEFLRLDLAAERYPSLGVRLQRTRDGKTEDLWPDWQIPLVDAYADYKEYLGTEVPPADPSDPKAAGPAQMDSKTFKYSHANESFPWTFTVDWTGAPPPSLQPAPVEPPPVVPAAPPTPKSLRALYLAPDQSEFYDMLAELWLAIQEVQINDQCKGGIPLDTEPGHMNLMSVRELQLFKAPAQTPLYPTYPNGPDDPTFPTYAAGVQDNILLEFVTATNELDARDDWDDTLFVIWKDLSGRKRVQAIALSTEPSTTSTDQAWYSWLSDPCQSKYYVSHHKSSPPEMSLRDVIDKYFSKGSSAPSTASYRAMRAGSVQPMQWRGRSDVSVPGNIRLDKASPCHASGCNIHFGGSSADGAMGRADAGSMWSLGCQVIYHASGYETLWRLLEGDGSLKGTDTVWLLPAPASGAHNREITYTLVAGADMKRILKL